MQNIVSTRFIECLNLLKESKDIRSYRQFALTTGVLPQALNYILKGHRNVTVDLIKRSTEEYKFNPIYLYTGKGEKFLKDNFETQDSMPVITVVSDTDNKEKIVHVPIAAMAGYPDSLHDPVFMEDLPTFSLPGQEFFSRTQRCFDVSGDSMDPTIENGDRVVCSFVEKECWKSNIRTGYIYVFVCKSEVLLKRAENKLNSHGYLVLHSDNDYYSPIEINPEEIIEVWIVKTKLSSFIQKPELLPTQMASLKKVYA